MSFQQTIEEVKKNTPTAATLILSGEEKLSESLVEELRKKMIAEEYIPFFGSEMDINNFTQSLFETGLFSSSRLYYIREFDEISWTDESKAAFLRWLQTGGSADHVILTGTKKGKIPKPILKAISEHGTLYELKALYERDIALMIKNLARDNQVRIADKVVDRMIELCGTNLQDIYSQWEKIMLYLGSEKELTLDKLNQTVDASSHFNVFQLIDSLMNGDYRRCIMISQSLLGANIHPLQPLSVLLNHFSQLELFALAAASGENLADIKIKLKMKDFVFRKIQNQISVYSVEKIQMALLVLNELDHELKTRGSTVSHSRLIFEKGILKLIHLLKK